MFVMFNIVSNGGYIILHCAQHLFQQYLMLCLTMVVFFYVVRNSSFSIFKIMSNNSRAILCFAWQRLCLRRIYVLDQEEGYCLTKVHKGGPFLSNLDLFIDGHI